MKTNLPVYAFILQLLLSGVLSQPNFLNEFYIAGDLYQNYIPVTFRSGTIVARETSTCQTLAVDASNVPYKLVDTIVGQLRDASSTAPYAWWDSSKQCYVTANIDAVSCTNATLSSDASKCGDSRFLALNVPTASNGQVSTTLLLRTRTMQAIADSFRIGSVAEQRLFTARSASANTEYVTTKTAELQILVGNLNAIVRECFSILSDAVRSQLSAAMAALPGQWSAVTTTTVELTSVSTTQLNILLAKLDSFTHELSAQNATTRAELLNVRIPALLVQFQALINGSSTRLRSIRTGFRSSYINVVQAEIQMATCALTASVWAVSLCDAATALSLSLSSTASSSTGLLRPSQLRTVQQLLNSTAQLAQPLRLLQADTGAAQLQCLSERLSELTRLTISVYRTSVAPFTMVNSVLLCARPASLLMDMEGPVSQSADTLRTSTIGVSMTQQLKVPGTLSPRIVAVPVAAAFSSRNQVLNLANTAVTVVARRLLEDDTEQQPEAANGDRDDSLSATTSTSHNRKLQQACPLGYYGPSCVICPPGTFSYDSILHLCFNAPLTDTQYIGSGGVNEDCPFVCTRDGYYRVGNFCAPIPTGYWSTDGSLALFNCSAPLRDVGMFTFTSGGKGNSTSCAFRLTYAAAVPQLSATVATLSTPIASFTVQLWAQLTSTYTPRSGGVGIGLVAAEGFWSLYLQAYDSTAASVQLARLVFDFGAAQPAHSAYFTLDSQWHHYGICGEDSQRTVVFYRDGIEFSNDWYSAASVRTISSVNVTLSVGGGVANLSAPAYPPAIFSIFKGFIDDVEVMQQRLPLQNLGYFRASNNQTSCDTSLSEIISQQCVPRCPLGSSRNLTAVTQLLTATTSSLSLNVSELCTCPTGMEWYHGHCLPQCPGGAERLLFDDAGTCLCSSGSYQAWAGMRYLTLFVPCADCLPTTITEVEIYDTTGAAIVPMGCTEAGVAVQPTCALLFDSLKEATSPRWQALTSPGRVTLDLGSSGRNIGSIRVYAYGSGPAGTSVLAQLSVYLSNTAVPTGSSSIAAVGSVIASQLTVTIPPTTVVQPALEITDRAITPNLSPALQCLSCPINTTQSVGSRTTIGSCICPSNSALQTGFCVAGLTALAAPNFTLSATVYPNGTQWSLYWPVDAAPDLYAQLTIVLQSRPYDILLTQFYQYSPPLVLTTNITIEARLQRPGQLQSPSTSRSYVIIDRASAPVILPSAEAALSGTAFVYMLCATPNTWIRYTVDGSAINETAPRYDVSAVILASPGVTVRAQAFHATLFPSHITVSTYHAPANAISEDPFTQFWNSIGSAFCTERALLCTVLALGGVLVGIITIVVIIIVAVLWKRDTTQAALHAAREAQIVKAAGDKEAKRMKALSNRKEALAVLRARQFTTENEHSIEYELLHNAAKWSDQELSSVSKLRELRAEMCHAVAYEQAHGRKRADRRKRRRETKPQDSKYHTMIEPIELDEFGRSDVTLTSIAMTAGMCEWCSRMRATEHCRDCIDNPESAQYVCEQCDADAHASNDTMAHQRTRLMVCDMCQDLPPELLYCNTCNVYLCKLCSKNPRTLLAVALLRHGNTDPIDFAVDCQKPVDPIIIAQVLKDYAGPAVDELTVNMVEHGVVDELGGANITVLGFVDVACPLLEDAGMVPIHAKSHQKKCLYIPACDMCGEEEAIWRCTDCTSKMCLECDLHYHRKIPHKREVIRVQV
eukprot:TRINITY_DN2728_c0_g1_i1.p1 TRINITY_DN2728_c0_g1~~TRINITY_DN2728_c0_g1_i1.p1  ORF type:complete len:1758 (-),score=312.29 TRINITY_DN2728_c0_g1_i1:101-5209(-)